jgi:peptidoglycan/xylan/chitin deacetylase (PgdA/CDA1 family)
MYHAITNVPDDPNNICVPPERFETQMLHLKRRGLCGVSINELTRAVRRGSARRLVGLTFDDGYENFLYAALPVLERFGFSATVFMVAGMLGKENIWDQTPQMRLLGEDSVREIPKRGMEVGSHGMNHVRLSDLEPEPLKQEVSGSRQVLSEVLDKAVEGFCYPYGSLDGRVAQAVRQAGYAYACAYKMPGARDVYGIPRIYVGERDGALRLELKLRWYRHGS